MRDSSGSRLSMRMMGKLTPVLLILWLAGCASGPRPPADPANQAREIQVFVDQLEQRCLDRNLTLNPSPRAGTKMPSELGETRGGGLKHACTNWRVRRGGSQLDNSFFVYRNHAALINEIKARFGVIYDLSYPIVETCMNGREHVMLLRDGETMIRVFYGYYVGKTYCSTDNLGRWQAVAVRMSKPCRVGDGTFMVCGPSGRGPEVFSGLVNEGQMVSDDVVIPRQNVINLQRLTDQEREQLEQAMLARDEDDAFMLRVAEGIDFLYSFQDESRDHSRWIQDIVDRSRSIEQERRDTRDRLIAEGLSDTLNRVPGQLAASMAQHQEFSEQIARTWRQQQAQQSLDNLRTRQQFNATQLPARLGGDAPPTQAVAAQQSVTTRPSRPETTASTRPSPQTVAATRDNQCWSVPEPPHSSCVTARSWERDGDVFISATNQCSRRVYSRACGGRLSGPDFCAVRGLLPGATWSHQVYANWQPTGSYHVEWVGSEKPIEDWVCANEAGWAPATQAQ